MKVLLVSNYFPNPGAWHEAPFLYWRAKCLIEQGVEVSVLKWDQNLNDFGAEDYLLSEVAPDRFSEAIPVKRVHTLSLMNPFVQRRLYRWVKSNFDVVHFHWLWSMSVLPKIHRWNIPFVVTCHGSDIYRLGESLNQFGVMRLLNRWECRRQMARLERAGSVMFVSKDLQEVAMQKGFRGASLISPNGYDSTLFHHNGRVPQDPPILGYVGNLVRVKGADRLPDILAKLSDLGQLFKVIIIGDGPLEPELRENFLKHGLDHCVEFLGRLPQDEVALWMRKMSVLMMPSRHEGFGCVVKEVQACGVSVVAAAVGGLPESVSDAGKLIEEGPCMLDAFAKGIASVLESPISKEDLEQSSKGYAWSALVVKEKEIYQQLL